MSVLPQRSATRRRRRALLVLGGVLAVVALLLAAGQLAGGSGDVAVAPVGVSPQPGDLPLTGPEISPPPLGAGPPLPGAPGIVPEPGDPGLSGDVARYVSACRRANASFAEADVVHPSRVELARDAAELVEAAVTLKTGRPPREVLDGPLDDEPVAQRVIVSCTVEAQLVGATGDVVVDPAGWQSQTLLTSPTATWSWYVTAQRRSVSSLTLEVRPVVLVEEGELYQAVPTTGTIARFRIDTDVTVALADRAQEGAGRVEALLKQLAGVVTALTVLVGGLVALRRALRLRRSVEPVPAAGPAGVEPAAVAPAQVRQAGADAERATT